MKLLLCLLALALLPGCVSEQRKNLDRGILVSRRMTQQDFLDAWGNPTRVFSSMALPDPPAANTNEWRGSFSMRKERPYDVWEYSGRGVSLWFFDEHLWAWKWHDGAKPKM